MRTALIPSAIMLLSISVDTNSSNILHHTDECGTNAQIEIRIGESNFSNSDVKYQSMSFHEHGFRIRKSRFFKQKIMFDAEHMYLNYRISGNILLYLTNFEKPYGYNITGKIHEAPFFCLDDTIGTTRNTFDKIYSSRLSKKEYVGSDTLYTYEILYNENCSHCTLVNELVINRKFQIKKITLYSTGGQINSNTCDTHSGGYMVYE